MRIDFSCILLIYFISSCLAWSGVAQACSPGSETQSLFYEDFESHKYAFLAEVTGTQVISYLEAKKLIAKTEGTPIVTWEGGKEHLFGGPSESNWRKVLRLILPASILEPKTESSYFLDPYRKSYYRIDVRVLKSWRGVKFSNYIYLGSAGLGMCSQPLPITGERFHGIGSLVPNSYVAGGPNYLNDGVDFLDDQKPIYIHPRKNIFDDEFLKKKIALLGSFRAKDEANNNRKKVPSLSIRPQESREKKDLATPPFAEVSHDLWHHRKINNIFHLYRRKEITKLYKKEADQHPIDLKAEGRFYAAVRPLFLKNNSIDFCNLKLFEKIKGYIDIETYRPCSEKIIEKAKEFLKCARPRTPGVKC